VVIVKSRTVTAAVEGGSLRVRVTGEGSPIVLLHGFTLDARMWDSVVPLLAKSHTVVSYDARGFGESSLPTTAYRHRDDLRMLLDRLELDRAHLVGHSIGAHQMLEFAFAYPERTRSYTGVCVSGLSGVPFPEDIREAFSAIGATAKGGDLTGAKAIWKKSRWFSPALEMPAVAKSLDVILDEYSGWHWQNENPAVPLEPTPASRLGELRVPALILSGELDTEYNHAIAARLTDELPNARHRTLTDIGHMAPMEAPEQVAHALLSFFPED
jgi:pimeloyl-ACP methyl ester carboxylesterase